MVMYLLLFIGLNLLAFAQAVYPCDGTTTNLDLSSRGLTVLPDLSMCTALTTLILHNNQLTALPAWIGQLINLQSLTVSFNRLAVFPPEIYPLVNLQSLDLNGNQITILPPEIIQLISLLHLSVSENQLTTLPPEFSLMVNLLDSDLNSNLLVTLPAEVGLLPHFTLSAYWIHGNPIVCLPAVVRDHVNWGLSGYLACDSGAPTTTPTVSPTSARFTAIKYPPPVEPTTVRHRLPPITELYNRASFPATRRQQSAATARSSGTNRNTQSQSGDEIKSKINKMREKVAAMRGEL